MGRRSLTHAHRCFHFKKPEEDEVVYELRLVQNQTYDPSGAGLEDWRDRHSGMRVIHSGA